MAKRKGKGKAGGKREYTMSPKALAQRRVAARVHGQRATSPARQILPACNRRQCPLADAQGNGFPCTMKETVEKQGRAIESCPVPFVADADLRRRYLNAMTTGDLGDLREIAAGSLAAQTEIVAIELSKVRDEGFVIEEEVPTGGVDGDGLPIMVTVVRKNPRVDPVLKFLENLGHTAEQQALTTKGQTEKKRDEGITGFLAAAASMQGRFAKPARGGGDE